MQQQLTIIVVLLIGLCSAPGQCQENIPLTDWAAHAYETFEEEGEAAGIDAFEEGLNKALAEQAYAAYLEILHEYGSAYTYIMGQPDVVISKLAIVDDLPFTPQTEDEWRNMAAIYVNLGYTYSLDLGRYADAFTPFQQAYQIFDSQLQDRSAYRAQYIEKPLGNICTRLGDYAAAEVHLRSAITILETLEAYDQAASTCNDLGLLYQNWERDEEARQAYTQGLDYPQLGANATTLLLINFADFLLDAGIQAEALDNLQIAERILDSASEEAIPAKRKEALQAGIYEKEALIQAELGDYTGAIENIQKAIQTATSYYETNRRREIAKLCNKQGQIFVKAQEFEKAVQQHQTALQCVVPGYDPKSINDLPEPEQFFAENTILESLEYLSTAYMAWHESENNAKLLENALACHERIHDVERHLQRSYRHNSSKLFNLEESRGRSERAIGIANKLFRQTGQEQYLYRAFVFAERSRSRLLREAFQRTQANELAGVNSADQEEEQALLQAISDAEEERYRLYSEPSPDSLRQFAEQQLLQAREDLRQWVLQLETNNPRYYQLRYADEAPILEQLREMLAAKEQLLEYFVGEEKLYVFRLDQYGFALHEQPLPANLAERVLSWRKAIEAYQHSGADRSALLITYQKEAYQLYQDLVSPVLTPVHDIDQLLIITSGILDLIPFEALLTGAVQPKSPVVDYPYLLHQYSISYGYAASLQWSLFQLERSGSQKAGFAPDFDRNSGWPPLSCSAALLQQTIGESGGTVLVDRDASIEQFQQIASQYRLLHLATHAQANPEQGDFSYIVFSDGQGGYDSLYAKDLYLYNLEAELVILSACETALGTLYNSEGVISLARAFHYAGARSVLNTSWRINEGANCTLLEAFYQELERGVSKREALRAAKLKYLETADPRAAHPVYWAGFQLLGNPRALEPGIPWHFYALAALILLIGGGSYWRYRTRRQTVQI